MKRARFGKVIAMILVVAVMACMMVTFASARSDVYAGHINTDGTRIRSNPVTGTVIGLAYKGDDMRIDRVQVGCSDGYDWFYGPVINADEPTVGWVREDLVNTYWV